MLQRILIAWLCLVLASCDLPADVVVLVPDEGGTVGKISVAKDGSGQELAEAYSAIDADPGARDPRPFVANEAAVRSAFAGALAATPRDPMVYTIFFIVGTADVDPGSAETLARALKAAKATENPDISVVGHSDATGDDAENLKLSLQRAQLVRDALVSEGVSPSVVELGYHGSNNPLVPTPNGVPEPRNRRVEVTIR